MNKYWGADAGFDGYKTPTSILLRPDESTHSFGFHAENEFSDLDEDDRKEGYLLTSMLQHGIIQTSGE